MVCPGCGASAAAPGAFCAQCGRRLPQDPVSVATLTPAPADTAASRDTGAAPLDHAATGSVRPDDDATHLQDPDETVAAPSLQLAWGAQATTKVLKPGDAFGTRYRILRVLGAGGMGIVYHAWDEELAEAVALKLIRPEISANPDAARDLEARFKRELLLARKVSHRNVIRIHDIGEVDGTKYISMSFVEGLDLATTLRTTGHLPVDRVVHFVRQLAAGLQEAHQVGVIHRDLKPANVMLEGNELVIMDFGIARPSGAPLASGAVGDLRKWSRNHLVTGATMKGAIVGTMAYMSPEQAKGEAADERSDIYSLGLVMRDMLVGMRSMTNATDVVDELMARIEHAPKPVQAIDPAIPDAVDAIVTRCLQPDPAARFQSVQELLAALDRLDLAQKPGSRSRPAGARLAIVALLAAIAVPAATWWLMRQPAPPAQHDPVSVLIADFENQTGDAAFDRTLEPMLRIALEDAGFITAFDRSAVRRSLGVPPPDQLDERAAREIAVKQGLSVVMAGGLRRQGDAYQVSARAIHAVTGNVLANVQGNAAGKAQVLAVATNLASDVREALGDDASDADRRFAMETLSATSIDVVKEYAAAAGAMSDSKFDVALDHFGKAVALDPKFGLGHAGLAIASRNLDRQQDAEQHIKEAVSHLDGMTERERYRTRGLFYMITGDHQQCVKEFGDLIARYAADASARNNLALCSTYLRDFPRAVDEMRKVIAILPKRALYRENLALYAAYSGLPEPVHAEVKAMPEPGLFALVALAFAQLLDGETTAAGDTYARLADFGTLGASYTASGLGDLALYEGRFGQAVTLFTSGAAEDVASGDSDRAANKYASLAYTQLLRGDDRAAIAAADRALQFSPAAKIRFLAGRVFAEAGAGPQALAQRESLASGLQVEPRAYAKILEGLTLLKDGNPRKAIAVLNEANALLDTWIGHFELGRAYLAAGAFTQADSEFDRCIKRRGEALSLFLDEEPTFGHFPAVYYYQGRTREGLTGGGSADAYRKYLELRGDSSEDSRVAEIRRRSEN